MQTKAVTVVLVGAYSVTTGQLDGIYLAMFLLIVVTVFEQTVTLAAIPKHFNDAKMATKRLQEIQPAQLWKLETLQPALTT